jgi:signal-transduction protein with cAMP-binding, CBS, and nucleotidyltransferase domain
MVTDRDLFIALGTGSRSASELPVGEIMHREPAVCSPADDVRNALKTMAHQQVHRLPVVDQSGELKGILSINDLVLRVKPDSNGVFKDDAIRTLKAICEHRSSAQSKQATA